MFLADLKSKGHAPESYRDHAHFGDVLHIYVNSVLTINDILTSYYAMQIDLIISYFYLFLVEGRGIISI